MPTLPPSGDSDGQIYPHCEPCNFLGPIALLPAGKGKVTLLNVAVVPRRVFLLISWTTPSVADIPVPHVVLNDLFRFYTSLTDLK